MKNKEFLNAVNLLKEKGIDEDTIYSAMELAMASAYKKHTGLENVRVETDRKTGTIKVYSYLTVVTDDDFTDPDYEIIIDEAEEKVPGIKVGETIEEEVKTEEFGRVAAATAKQVVIQKIREAERNNIKTEFEDKQDEMVTGIVDMEDFRNYYINFNI